MIKNKIVLLLPLALVLVLVHTVQQTAHHAPRKDEQYNDGQLPHGSLVLASSDAYNGGLYLVDIPGLWRHKVQALDNLQSKVTSDNKSYVWQQQSGNIVVLNTETAKKQILTTHKRIERSVEGVAYLNGCWIVERGTHWLFLCASREYTLDLGADNESLAPRMFVDGTHLLCTKATNNHDSIVLLDVISGTVTPVAKLEEYAHLCVDNVRKIVYVLLRDNVLQKWRWADKTLLLERTYNLPNTKNDNIFKGIAVASGSDWLFYQMAQSKTELGIFTHDTDVCNYYALNLMTQRKYLVITAKIGYGRLLDWISK